MLDFMIVSEKRPKKGVVEVYPKFIINPGTTDLIIRGSDFYAIWNEDEKLWSTSEGVAIKLIDKELDDYFEKHKEDFVKKEEFPKVLHLWDSDSKMVDNWHRYCQKQMRDTVPYHELDATVIFSNTDTSKKDYASKKLPYPLEQKDTPAYDELMSVLYSPEERRKIEWAIGSIVSGESKKLQKFLVMYGAAGTGKSTVLNIVQDLFEGYYSVFDSRALGSANNSFALEAFKSNPLVAIQHDGDLSHIEDNTRLNSLVSHEMMTVNEKFKSTYATRFNSFLFMGTNKPVRITDAKSGIIRRLIDVTPTGKKIPSARYKTLMSKIKFELGGIADHCMRVYSEDPAAYDNYIPTNMLGASNDFYNFVLDSYDIFKRDDGTTLKQAWEMYLTYCETARLQYPMNQRSFREELRTYFEHFQDKAVIDEDTTVRNYFSGFNFDRFRTTRTTNDMSEPTFIFNKRKSLFDEICADCPAQYANENEVPSTKWENVKTKLSDIDTTKLHYVQLPPNHIYIDFDLKDENGNKSFELNYKAIQGWPKTYAELSKGGNGIHLHYIYNGDVNMLSRIYSKDIEVKVQTGNASLRRRLSKCNDAPIATISGGLPLKETKMLNFDGLKNEKALRTVIKKNLRKEIHGATKPSCDMIFKVLDDAYASGMHYDVSDMRNDIINFAANSSNQAGYCLKLTTKMKFKSDEPTDNSEKYTTDKLIFYDVEVFPNLFVVCWKMEGENHKVNKMINPDANDIEKLIKYKLVGFNCRRYDNHILYARLMGYTNEQLYRLSQKIISKSPDCFFSEAYNLSYTDIFDFASAANKKSLKKFEIELGIHHQECEFKWDEDVPEDKWDKVADYCVNDVLATEATFNHLKGDWTARQILADVAGMTPNDTTNSLTTRIIFGRERHPKLIYTHLDTGVQE